MLFVQGLSILGLSYDKGGNIQKRKIIVVINTTKIKFY